MRAEFDGATRPMRLISLRYMTALAMTFLLVAWIFVFRKVTLEMGAYKSVNALRVNTCALRVSSGSLISVAPTADHA